MDLLRAASISRWRERTAADGEHASDARLQIGQWTVNPAANELCRGRQRTHLEPKAMAVLLLLAARPGEAVNRAALLDAVWPGVVVGDEALTQSIIKLRKALGDNPRAPGYIETIPKRGYRLIARVAPGSVDASATRLTAAPRRGMRVLAIGARVVLLLGLTAGSWFIGSRSRSPPAVAANGDVIGLDMPGAVSRGPAARLPGRINDAQRRRLAKRGTTSVTAYEYLLRAQALFLVRQPQENEQARDYYAKAIAEDPQFARAYAGLAMTYAMDYRFGRSGDAAATLARAQDLAESARQIDPDSAEVQWALGFVLTQSRHYEAATQALEQAIRLNPSYADAYALLGGICTYTGAASRSIPMLRKALRYDPGGGYLDFLLLGRAYLFDNDLEQALINLREATRRNPEDIETHVYLAATLVAAGDATAAQFEADEVRVREAGFSTRAWLKTYPLASEPYRRELLQLTASVLP